MDSINPINPFGSTGWKNLTEKHGRKRNRREQDPMEALFGWIDDIGDWVTGRETYQEERIRTEQEQYWEDYQKNTGVEPRYPIMAGMDRNFVPQMPMGLTPQKLMPMDALYGKQTHY